MSFLSSSLSRISLRWLSSLALGVSLLACSLPGEVQARADVSQLYTDALLNRDVAMLDALLAGNYIYVGSNGHIQDKEHFLASIRSGDFVVKNMSFRNMRETRAGGVRVITGNGTFAATAKTPVPTGLIRTCMVTEEVMGEEKVVLVQLTPVVPSADCQDGNCRIR